VELSDTRVALGVIHGFGESPSDDGHSEEKHPDSECSKRKLEGVLAFVGTCNVSFTINAIMLKRARYCK
jgi:hypothetical protein